MLEVAKLYTSGGARCEQMMSRISPLMSLSDTDGDLPFGFFFFFFFDGMRYDGEGWRGRSSGAI